MQTEFSRVISYSIVNAILVISYVLKNILFALKKASNRQGAKDAKDAKDAKEGLRTRRES